MSHSLLSQHIYRLGYSLLPVSAGTFGHSGRLRVRGNLLPDIWEHMVPYLLACFRYTRPAVSDIPDSSLLFQRSPTVLFQIYPTANSFRSGRMRRRAARPSTSRVRSTRSRRPRRSSGRSTRQVNSVLWLMLLSLRCILCSYKTSVYWATMHADVPPVVWLWSMQILAIKTGLSVVSRIRGVVFYHSI